MFKIPITTEGEVRYLEILKYAVILGLVYNLYTGIVQSNVMRSLFTFVQVSSILVFFVLLQILIVATLELYALIKYITRPILQYIDDLRVTITPLFTNTLQSLFTQVHHTYTNIQLQVIRC